MVSMSDDGYFDLSPTDRSMAILDRSSPVAFHVIWDLIGDVDLESLAWAWEALARIHPIVSCTTDVEAADTWRLAPEPTPLNAIDGGSDFDAVTARQVAMTVDPSEGPILRLDAISRTDGIRVVLAAHHAAFDGAASVLLIDDLRRLYVSRCSGGAPQIEPDQSPRTVKAALSQSRLPFLTTQSYITQSLNRWRRLPASTHTDPSLRPAQPATGYVTMEVGPAIDSIDDQRRRNSWPMDAVLVGILEAAWNDVFGRNEVGAGVWLVSSNLRPGLGVTRGIGNLSGVEAVAVTRPDARPVDAVIEQAAAEIAATRSGFPGLGPELLARTWGWLPASVVNQGVDQMISAGERQRYTRVISNMGRLPESLADWGPIRLEGLRYLGPMSRAPYTMFVALSHRGSTTLTVRTAPDWLTPEHARALELAIYRNCGLNQPRPGPGATPNSSTADV